MPLTVSGKGTTFVCFDTLSPRPSQAASLQPSPPNMIVPYRSLSASSCSFHDQPEKRTLAAYLSLPDRYSKSHKIRWFNTIRRRFRVNRDHMRPKVFQWDVLFEQQWQNGDRL